LSLGEGHSLAQETHLILYEFLLLHIVLLFVEKLLQESRIGEKKETLVESIEDEEASSRVIG
jgi:hypothetical protein